MCRRFTLKIALAKWKSVFDFGIVLAGKLSQKKLRQIREKKHIYFETVYFKQ